MKHVELWEQIQKKSGVKVIAIQLKNSSEYFELNEDFQEKAKLLKVIKKGIEKGGAMIIRQMVSEEQSFVAGVMLGQYKYLLLPAEDTERSFSRDENGKLLPKEKGVEFITLDEMN